MKIRVTETRDWREGVREGMREREKEREKRDREISLMYRYFPQLNTRTRTGSGSFV